MKFSFSLAFQITVLFTLITMLAVIGAGSLSFLEGKKAIETQFEKTITDIATTIAGSVNEKTDSAATSIMRLSAFHELYGENNGEIEKILKIVVETSNIFHSIYFFAPEGQIRALAYADGRDLEKYRSENYLEYQNSDKTLSVFENLIKARDSQSPVFSTFFKSATGRLMNTFIIPVIDSGRVHGLLSCSIALDNTSALLEMMEVLKPHPKGYVALYDEANKIVLSAGSIPEKLASETTGIGSDMKIFREDGYIQARRRLDKMGLGIMTGLPEEVILTMLDDLRVKTVFYAAGAGLVATVLGFLVASFLISPLSRLHRGLRQLKEEGKAERISVIASGEIHAAIAAFNDLCEKLMKK